VIIARIVLELRAAIPPAISTDPAEMDPARWEPWRVQAMDALTAQAEQAAPKLNCKLVGVSPAQVEVRMTHPVGRWLRVEFEMEFSA
jgi:hypothetical protein